ncbi:MAG: UDP-N-acetyl-D-mannosamine dehydrogenase [Methylicorpusculum sp.]|uniref:UDP-N-acetyl-D-mannosamine dehydrogenase n=1 Tax=Methylicorpusculum sp. TaxID=2713644 RepID=UPI002725FF6A|nr:UDP-N-acetyl-D-mannosamine dehydrogenase [Methylicorpusculum sp.]MDO8844257.1 UDP-N-acetyl-D-mannosamine dehydrogenase [Methylicorpusculum sp.]MDO8938927.1 UDP-N-acetyl-D-mannosamine dehydrogenase [Methylicorpusculum sp.]MDP2203970.1 UDP-N-acetyl-D-mannosamine dehydrogenase [Methylicorpusculum sp.]MDP3531478.1 UDP-N-acetyl-D-mannosamine dehydrogenase [Methylicorpusculum sp.]MDZ4152764.1 UDP-N-acetyl-D-mannosamine dehydrogenase [Methylicorpusculum sp.]
MQASETKVCVIGLGYIGLPTASLLGTKGFEVFGVDTSEHVVDTINQGKIHIVEPDLDILVKSAVQSGNLKAGLKPVEADIFILAVPTPFKDNHIPDLSYVEAATRVIAPYVKPGNIVILESTSPVGTTDDVVAKILKEHGHNVGRDVYVAHCPERVLPGRILTELVENDRIVGGINAISTDKVVEFYQTFVRGEILATDAKTAELSKLSENSFRDVNIAFANELSLICDKENINVWELIKLANRHPRVNILQPGPGVGGHCIAVDPWFIVARAPEYARLIKTAREVNDAKPHWVIEKVKASADKFKNPVIGCLGLAFKADVDDLRESPAVEIVKHIQEQNIGEVLVAEPNLVSHKAFDLLPYQEVIKRSDIILLLVDHKPFKSLKAVELKEKILIDTRGVIK